MTYMTPIEEAANSFAAIMEQMDDALEMRPTLVASFRECKKSLDDQVSEVQANAEYLQGLLDMVYARQKALTAYATRLKRVKKALEEDTLKAIDTVPGVKLRGDTGRALYVSSNKKLVMHHNIRMKQSASNIVDAFTASLLGIDHKYLKLVEFYQLDAGQVKKDLLAGEKLSWATLEQTRHIAGLFPPNKTGDKNDNELSEPSAPGDVLI